jgi:hypothetical protein
MVDGLFLISQLPPLRHFLFRARGSLVELETQILRAGKLQYLSAAIDASEAPQPRGAGV